MGTPLVALRDLAFRRLNEPVSARWLHNLRITIEPTPWGPGSATKPSNCAASSTPATARPANQLDKAVTLVTLATVLMGVLIIVILHGEPRPDLGPPNAIRSPSTGTRSSRFDQ